MMLSNRLERLELGKGRAMNVYYTVYALGFLLVAGALISYPKAELHLMLNSWHSPFWDGLFRFFSTLAEWPLYVLALLPLIFRKKRWVLCYAICEATNAVIVFVTKMFILTPRPSYYFKLFYPDVQLPLVDGVHLHRICSFPSGHSTTFFIFCTYWGIILAHSYYRQNLQETSWGRKTAQAFSLLLLLMAASIGGFSRIYLSQHFLLDVWAGSFLGICIVSLMFWFYAPEIEKTK